MVRESLSLDPLYVAPVAHLALRFEWPHAYVQPSFELGAAVLDVGPRGPRALWAAARGLPIGGPSLAIGAHAAPTDASDFGLGLSAALAVGRYVEASDLAGTSFAPSVGPSGYARIALAPGVELDVEASLHASALPSWFARARLAAALVWRWC